MMILPLRADCLDKPTAYDVTIVAATMLWPKDDALRNRAIATMTVELVLQSRNHPQPETLEETKQFLTLVRSTQVGDFDDDVAAGYTRGMIAGAMLRRAVAGEAVRPGKVGLTEIKALIAAKFTRERISVSTINNNIWHNYRCVASYWAAYQCIGSFHRDAPIPCSPSELGIFLAIADDFRRRAEATRTKPKSPGMLLRKGETIAIPSSLKLPRGKLDFVDAARTPRKAKAMALLYSMGAQGKSSI